MPDAHLFAHSAVLLNAQLNTYSAVLHNGSGA